MWKFVVFLGKVFLLGIVFLLPIFLFARFQGRIKNKSLYLLASLAAVDLSFFLCSFVGLYLDPRAQSLSLWERLIVSLLFIIVLTVIMIITLPIRRLASSLFSWKPRWLTPTWLHRLESQYDRDTINALIAEWRKKDQTELAAMLKTQQDLDELVRRTGIPVAETDLHGRPIKR